MKKTVFILIKYVTIAGMAAILLNGCNGKGPGPISSGGNSSNQNPEITAQQVEERRNLVISILAGRTFYETSKGVNSKNDISFTSYNNNTNNGYYTSYLPYSYIDLSGGYTVTSQNISNQYIKTTLRLNGDINNTVDFDVFGYTTGQYFTISLSKASGETLDLTARQF